MKKNAFLDEKASKRKSAKNSVWILLFFAALIIFMMAKIFFTGSLKSDTSGGLPTNEDAYEVAKEYVRPTLKGSGASFEDDGYGFAKTSDSVYVIKSTVETESLQSDKPLTTEFKIILKYNGGQVSKKSNWSVLSLSIF